MISDAPKSHCNFVSHFLRGQGLYTPAVDTGRGLMGGFLDMSRITTGLTATGRSTDCRSERGRSETGLSEKERSESPEVERLIQVPVLPFAMTEREYRSADNI